MLFAGVGGYSYLYDPFRSASMITSKFDIHKNLSFISLEWDFFELQVFIPCVGLVDIIRWMFHYYCNM